MKKMNIALIALCLLMGCVESPDTTVNIGNIIPSFHVVDNYKIVVNTAERGPIYVVGFINPSCPDCRDAMPDIERLYRKRNPSERWILIGRDVSSEELKDYWSANEYSVPFCGGDREIYKMFCESGIPRIYIADENGIIKIAFDDRDISALKKINSSISNYLKN